MTTTQLTLLVVVGVLLLAAVVALAVLLIVARRHLRDVRGELESLREQQGRRRRRLPPAQAGIGSARICGAASPGLRRGTPRPRNFITA